MVNEEIWYDISIVTHVIKTEVIVYLWVLNKKNSLQYCNLKNKVKDDVLIIKFVFT